MQMTNDKAYFKGKASRTDPSRQELKLRAARRSGDPKKIVEALNQLLGVEVTSHPVMMATLIDLIRSTFHSLECKLSPEPPTQNL
jgi:hypothetical protein